MKRAYAMLKSPSHTNTHHFSNFQKLPNTIHQLELAAAARSSIPPRSSGPPRELCGPGPFTTMPILEVNVVTSAERAEERREVKPRVA